jgi:hypothetical protein
LHESGAETTEGRLAARGPWTPAVSCGAGGPLVTFHIPEVGATAPERQALLVRLFCHWVINRLPNEALPELSQTLGQIFEFYRHRPVAHSSTRRHETWATLADSHERPVFHVTQD